MIVGATARTQTCEPIGRFVRTPKGILLVILAALAVPAIYLEGAAQVVPDLIGITATAAALDIAIVGVRRGVLVFPSGAILSGLIMGVLLKPAEPWYVSVVAAVVAIGSKHLLRVGRTNIFNPAALGLVATYVLFGSAQSWWGAAPDLGTLAVAMLLVSGAATADRVNRLPSVLAFLGAYFALFTVSSFVMDPARVAEVFRAPDLQAVLFFAFFMVDDPPTSPTRYGDQIIFGGIAALAGYLLFLLNGAVCYLLVGLLAANAWQAYRRPGHRRSKEALRKCGPEM